MTGCPKSLCSSAAGGIPGPEAHTERRLGGLLIPLVHLSLPRAASLGCPQQAEQPIPSQPSSFSKLSSLNMAEESCVTTSEEMECGPDPEVATDFPMPTTGRQASGRDAVRGQSRPPALFKNKALQASVFL